MPLMVSQTADKPKQAHLLNRPLHQILPFNLSSWQMKTEQAIQEIPEATAARLSLRTKIKQETMKFLISQKQRTAQQSV